MNKFFNKLIEILLIQSTKKRRLILILTDCLLISSSLWTIYFFSIEESSKLLNIKDTFELNIILLLIGIVIYSTTGQYKSLIKYLNSKSLYNILFRNFLLTLLFSSFSNFLNYPFLGLKLYILFWILISNSIIFIRLIIKDSILNLEFNKSYKKSLVAIYGAGEAGARLAMALKLSNKWKVVLFIDDSPNLWDRYINGIPIKPLKYIDSFRPKIEKVLLAIPSLNFNRRRKIINSLVERSIPILSIPSFEEITDKGAKIDNLKPIQIKDLLYRDQVEPNKSLLEKGITNLTILVTGAGGSIGSELTSQIIKLKPKKIILFERNEPSLYKISKEIDHIKYDSTIVNTVIGDTLNNNQLNKIFCESAVDLVFHCAAYKHVPMVQDNPISGIHNNVISTYNLCKVCIENKVKKMILISSDKAVRPTNVMGASKRLSELIVKGFAHKENISKKTNNKTCFSMVRFGNVLDSSGSVVPLFKEQIAKGGPLTVTHKNVERFFMTMPEASQLVIQSSIMAEGGDVFLLDMGKPIKISDLANRMIKLSGLTVKNKDNPDGDIEIIYTGLRKGEKLFEELLIDGKAYPTNHPLIYKAKEELINSNDFWDKISTLEKYIKEQDENNTLKILSKLVPEWINKN